MALPPLVGLQWLCLWYFLLVICCSSSFGWSAVVVLVVFPISDLLLFLLWLVCSGCVSGISLSYSLLGKTCSRRIVPETKRPNTFGFGMSH